MSAELNAVCRLYLSPHRKLQTTIADSTRHPVWNEDYQLLVSSYRDDVLTLILYDHDRVTADESLGRCTHFPQSIVSASAAACMGESMLCTDAASYAHQTDDAKR